MYVLYVLLKMGGFPANHVSFQGCIGQFVLIHWIYVILRPSKGQVDALLLCASTDRVFAIKAMGGIPIPLKASNVGKYTVWATKS